MLVLTIDGNIVAIITLLLGLLGVLRMLLSIKKQPSSISKEGV